MKVSLERIVKILNENNKFCILTHQYPDGDTLGSAFALCRILQKIGKKAKVVNNDSIPPKFNFLKSCVKQENFEPEFIVSVDVADEKLLGPNLKKYCGKVDLLIDHHKINENFAKYSYVDAGAAATAQIIYEIMNIIKTGWDSYIANCIYTGIATDTGCFKYKNTTAKTHKIAAAVLELGAEKDKINTLMFEQKTKEQFIAEKYIMDSIEFYFENKLAIIYVTLEMLEKSGADDSLIDGIAGIPKQIEGVVIGVTFRQKEEDVFKVSVRTSEEIDASLLCKHFGGGGHTNAAGFTIKGSLEEAKEEFISYAKTFIKS